MVATRARSGAMRYTAASSRAVPTPCSTLGSTIGGRAPSTCPSSTGLSLQAEPAPWLYWVSLSGETIQPPRLALVKGRGRGTPRPCACECHEGGFAQPFSHRPGGLPQDRGVRADSVGARAGRAFPLPRRRAVAPTGDSRSGG